MATVWEVRGPHDEILALKVLSSSSISAAERMVREGRVQQGLQHENIVRIHEVLTVNGAPHWSWSA